MLTPVKILFTLYLAAIFTGCASPLPRPQSDAFQGEGLSGADIFSQIFVAHGGNNLPQLQDLNVAIEGDWRFLITRIQPLVTDHRYRVRSQERIIPSRGIYAAHYRGPAGKKQVFRNREKVDVHYNGKQSLDEEVLRSSALTADAFLIFSLGPLALQRCADKFIRLSDQRENGRRFYRLYCELTPGIGFSQRDELVLWADKDSLLAYRVHITLEGYKTTRGAHVDVTFRKYIKRGGFLFPSVFHERVRGPIAIAAHHWALTGIDLNRGLSEPDLIGEDFTGAASRPATSINASANKP